MNGKTHQLTTDLVSLGTAATGIVTLVAAHNPAALLIAGGIFVGGRWLTPDLDTQSMSFNNWGRLKFLWVPYRDLVPHRGKKTNIIPNRSVISHSPLLSNLLRVVYAGIAIGLLLIPIELLFIPLGFSLFAALFALFKAHCLMFLMFYTGLEISTDIHLLLDILGTKINENRRANRKQFRQ